MSPSFGRCRSLSALVLVLATACPLAAATPALLRQASQIAVLAPTDATAKTYRPGETVFDEPLLWSGGAKLAHGLSVTVHGRSATITPGESLPAARLRIDGGGPAIDAFCTPRRAAERALDKPFARAMLGGVLTRKLLKSMTDEQFCLFARTPGGRLDQVALVNAGGNSGVADIDPIEFSPGRMIAIGPADRVRVIYRGLGFGTTEPMFELEFIQQGRKRVFDSMSTESGTGMTTAKRFTFVSSKHGWPADVNLLGLRFAVTGLDPASKGVTIAWPTKDGAPRQLVVSDDVQYVMRPY